jgi:hypothetical protein
MRIAVSLSEILASREGLGMSNAINSAARPEQLKKYGLQQPTI